MIKWPYSILTSEGESRVLLKEALLKAPDLRHDGLTGEGPAPSLVLIGFCNDFLMAIRPRNTVDDSCTAAERARDLEAWAAYHKLPTDGLHGAFIAAALGGARFTYNRVGISCHLNLSSRDFADRLTSLSRHLRR